MSKAKLDWALFEKAAAAVKQAGGASYNPATGETHGVRIKPLDLATCGGVPQRNAPKTVLLKAMLLMLWDMWACKLVKVDESSTFTNFHLRLPTFTYFYQRSPTFTNGHQLSSR